MYNVGMFQSYQKVKEPFYPQGHVGLNNYFEGWYYKQVHAKSGRSLSFIFGFSTAKSNPHSFIQVIQTDPLQTYYFSYPLEAYQHLGDRIRIGSSHFSKEHLTIQIDEPDFTANGELHFSNTIGLNCSRYSPSIMGPFAYLKGMECNHGVISMHHSIHGTLNVQNQILDFNQDIGYLEKDWGFSFPKRYIWMQGNHFSNGRDNFMVSVADIPFGLFHFEGIIAELNLGGKNYRIATYHGAYKTKLQKTSDGFILQLKQGSLSLTFAASIHEKAPLVSPLRGSMQATIKEGLGGKVCLQLKELNSLLYDGCSQHCGIEIENY